MVFPLSVCSVPRYRSATTPAAACPRAGHTPSCSPPGQPPPTSAAWYRPPPAPSRSPCRWHRADRVCPGAEGGGGGRGLAESLEFRGGEALMGERSMERHTPLSLLPHRRQRQGLGE